MAAHPEQCRPSVPVRSRLRAICLAQLVAQRLKRDQAQVALLHSRSLGRHVRALPTDRFEQPALRRRQHLERGLASSTLSPSAFARDPLPRSPPWLPLVRASADRLSLLRCSKCISTCSAPLPAILRLTASAADAAALSATLTRLREAAPSPRSTQQRSGPGRTCLAISSSNCCSSAAGATSKVVVIGSGAVVRGGSFASGQCGGARRASTRPSNCGRRSEGKQDK